MEKEKAIREKYDKLRTQLEQNFKEELEDAKLNKELDVDTGFVSKKKKVPAMSDDEVELLMDAYEQGATKKELMREYGLTKYALNKIIETYIALAEQEQDEPDDLLDGNPSIAEEPEEDHKH